MEGISNFISTYLPYATPALIFLGLLVYIRKEQVNLAKEGITVDDSNALLLRLRACLPKDSFSEHCTTYYCFSISDIHEDAETIKLLNIYAHKNNYIDNVSWVTGNILPYILAAVTILLIIMAGVLSIDIGANIIINVLFLIIVISLWVWYSGMVNDVKSKTSIMRRADTDLKSRYPCPE